MAIYDLGVTIWVSKVVSRENMKVEKGLDQSLNNKVHTHEEAGQLLAKWLK